MLVAVAEHDLPLGIKRESILMDAPTYESVKELLANVNDLHVWAAAVMDQDPELRNDGKATNKVVATMSTLNAYATEWKATGCLHASLCCGNDCKIACLSSSIETTFIILIANLNGYLNI